MGGEEGTRIVICLLPANPGLPRSSPARSSSGRGDPCRGRSGRRLEVRRWPACATCACNLRVQPAASLFPPHGPLLRAGGLGAPGQALPREGVQTKMVFLLPRVYIFGNVLACECIKGWVRQRPGLWGREETRLAKESPSSSFKKWFDMSPP